MLIWAFCIYMGILVLLSIHAIFFARCYGCDRRGDVVLRQVVGHDEHDGLPITQWLCRECRGKGKRYDWLIYLKDTVELIPLVMIAFIALLAYKIWEEL